MDNYGRVFEESFNTIALWWYSVPFTNDRTLPARDDTTDAGKALGGSGVYAFEGRHDSRPEGGLLYIGRVGTAMDADGSKASSRCLHDRIVESAGRFVWRGGTKSAGRFDKSGLYADVWDLRVRFAVVEPDFVENVESLLIRAHAPSFNAQQVRGPIARPEALSYLVMNDGDKGRLLPAVAGAYFDPLVWSGMQGG